MQKNNQTASRLPELNWIRGLSAILVILYHYTTRYQSLFELDESWPLNFPWGCGAVNTFFLLSGFLTAMTFREETKFVDYAKKRLVRLYPAYWTCVILTSIVMLLAWNERFVGLPNLLVNLTMLQGFLGVTPVDGAYWTLMYELQFYIYVAAILFIRKGKWLRPLVFIGVAMSIVLHVLAPSMGQSVIYKLCHFAILREYGISFFGGILLCFVRKRRGDIASYIGILCCLILSYFQHTFTYFCFYIATSVILFLVNILHTERYPTYVLTVEKLDKTWLRGLSFVAKISFPLYLIHQNIGIAILSHLKTVGWTSELVILIPIATSFILAYMIWRFVECRVNRRTTA